MSTSYITLVTNDSYVAGALTLGKVLKAHHNTKHNLAILLDTASVAPESVDLIKTIYDDVIDIKDQLVHSSKEDVVKILGRPELSVTFTKILLWSLTQYDKLIYLDADTLPVKDLDHLFEAEVKDGEVHASPDAGWPDIFNSGVLVLKPSTKTYEELAAATSSTSSFDGADQGLLNEHFNVKSQGKNWKRLPFVYNVTATDAGYQYNPALDRFGDSIHLFHFIGLLKPWDSEVPFGVAGKVADIHQLWWLHFNKYFDADTASKILKLRGGEASKLSFSKIGNQWDRDVLILEADEALEEPSTQLPPVFPWESREVREPTRVFDSHDDNSEQDYNAIRESVEAIRRLNTGN